MDPMDRILQWSGRRPSGGGPRRAAVRPWRLRGVPTPTSRRISTQIEATGVHEHVLEDVGVTPQMQRGASRPSRRDVQTGVPPVCHGGATVVSLEAHGCAGGFDRRRRGPRPCRASVAALGLAPRGRRSGAPMFLANSVLQITKGQLTGPILVLC